MALPTTILGTGGQEGHHPPFKSSGGNFYAIARNNVALQMFKATDPTDSWTEQDDTNDPVRVSSWFEWASVQDADLIHIAAVAADGYHYHTFNMADDTWGVTNELIETPPDFPQLAWISIAVRSDGDVIVAYNGDSDKSMGDTKQRVDYARREGGTWTVGVALDAGGDVHYGQPNVVKGPLTDDMHFVWNEQNATTPDPPTTYPNSNARTLDSSNTLSTVDTTGFGSGDFLLGRTNLVSYEDSGTQRIMSPFAHDTPNQIRLTTFTEDGSDDIQHASNVVVTNDDVFALSEIGILTIAELSGDLFMLFAGGGVAGVDRDLYYTTSTDDGATWTSPTEELDGINLGNLSANIYVRGADTVMAYVYDDVGGGGQKYNEKILIAGAPPTGQQLQMLV